MENREQMNQTDEKKLNKKQIAIIAILLLVIVGCIIYLISDAIKRKNSEQIYEEMRATESVVATEIAEAETEEAITCERVYDFDELRAENEDIYAWIVVPGTQVDYPVLQSETDNYYLDRNVDGSSGYPGALYTNKCNAKDFSDYNTVIYGHNMGNGTMFGCLHEFEDETFFDENNTIIVYTDEKRLTYEIYAAVKFNDKYIPAYYDVNTPDGTLGFVAAIDTYMDEEESHKRAGLVLGVQDKMITLSTCVKNERERRYLIVGRLIEEAYYKEDTQ